MKITILGCGNLGFSIAKGLANKAKENNLEITATTPDGDLDEIKKYGINAIRENAPAIPDAEIIFLCVKPWIAEGVLKEISGMLKDNQIIISPVAGLKIQTIKEYLGKENQSIFRIMPNIAAAVNQSTTCVSCSASESDKQKVNQLLSLIGKVIEIPEDKINAATILTGSGIAFAMRFMRAMVEGGIEIGFPSKVAEDIVNQTIMGTISLVQSQEGTHIETLIDRVCTPSGTTIRGLNEMERNGFSSSVIEGILSAYNKIK